MTQFGVHPSSSGPLARKLMALVQHENNVAATIRRQRAETAALEAAAAAARAEREHRRRVKAERMILMLERAKTLIPKHKTAGAVAAILKRIAAKHGVTVADIMSDRRCTDIVLVRHEAMYVISQETRLSLTSIGKLLHRDHTTVRHGIMMHMRRLEGMEEAA